MQKISWEDWTAIGELRRPIKCLVSEKHELVSEKSGNFISPKCWQPCKVMKLHRIACIKRMTPIDLGVNMSKVKVTMTLRVKTVSAQ